MTAVHRVPNYSTQVDAQRPCAPAPPSRVEFKATIQHKATSSAASSPPHARSEGSQALLPKSAWTIRPHSTPRSAPRTQKAPHQRGLLVLP